MTRDIDLTGHNRVVIGRRPPIEDPSVSRQHAIITRESDGTLIIKDLHSYGGTFVNNKRIYKAQRLSLGDVIRIGRFEFIFKPDKLEEKPAGLSIEASNLRKEIGDKKNLLQNVSFFIPAGKFIAIVGESGCGKSTLLKALNGIEPATEGVVSVIERGRKYDLYECYDSFRNQFGYVPQEDIIHRELKVIEALNYAARLRMPDDVTSQERGKRIKDVLKILDLSDKRDQTVATLSGGERKRVSIAVELLSSPSLFFLDEATSGLDPHHEAELMDKLKELSGKGQTIILVTHATQNIWKCDLVAFMAKEHERYDERNKRGGEKRKPSGYLVYYDSPDAAKRFFNVNSFDDIYRILEDKGDRWMHLYRKSKEPAIPIEKRRTPKPAQKQSSPLLQLFTLFQRDVNVLIRDKVSLILMLLVAPIVALLSATFWRDGLFSPAGGDAELAITNLFMTAIICCIVGSISSMREIVKEKDIYRRERMVSLQIVPYILSKSLIAVTLAIYQAAIFISVMKIASGWPESHVLIFQVYLTLFLATLAGMMQGLLVSAIAPNQNVAPLLLIIIIVFQLVLGGIIPERDRGPIVNKITTALGAVTTTKWTFESMVTLSGLGVCVANDPCWKLTEEERGKLTEQYKSSTCNCMGPKLFKNCYFPGIKKYYGAAIDENEPAKPIKPTDPGDPPAQPEEPKRSQIKSTSGWTEAWQQYQDDLKKWGDRMYDYHTIVKNYQAQLKSYEEEVDSYTERYKQWQENRSRAVGKAEGLISTMQQNYGHAFQVNLRFNWAILASFSIIIFIILLFAQRLKDQV